MRAFSLLLSGFALTFAVFFDPSPKETGDQKADAKPTTIVMKSLSFDPKELQLNIGGSVIWTNESRASHTALSDDDGKTFDTGSEVGLAAALRRAEALIDSADVRDRCRAVVDRYSVQRAAAGIAQAYTAVVGSA